jgi:hypothetical protein
VTAAIDWKNFPKEKSQFLCPTASASMSLSSSPMSGYAAMQIYNGLLYLQIVEGGGPKSLSFMVKNIRSLVKLVPGAAREAEEYFNKAIGLTAEIGARFPLAHAHLGLGLLHRAKGRKEKPRESISKAIEIFEECEADVFLKQARAALAELG